MKYVKPTFTRTPFVVGKAPVETQSAIDDRELAKRGLL